MKKENNKERELENFLEEDSPTTKIEKVLAGLTKKLIYKKVGGLYQLQAKDNTFVNLSGYVIDLINENFTIISISIVNKKPTITFDVNKINKL